MAGKVLIAYASHRGGTEKVANQLMQIIGPQACTLSDIGKRPHEEPDPYDVVIVGGPVYAGKAIEQVSAYCKKHRDILLQKKLYLFLCGMNKPRFEDELKASFHETLLQHARKAVVVGGEFDFEKLNWVERQLTKWIAKVHESKAEYNTALIVELGEAVRTEAQTG